MMMLLTTLPLPLFMLMLMLILMLVLAMTMRMCARRRRFPPNNMPPLHPLLLRVSRPLQIRRIDSIQPPIPILPRHGACRTTHSRRCRMVMCRCRRKMAHETVMLVDATFTPHTHTLDLAEFEERKPAYESRCAEAEACDSCETEVGFFDEVLQVHAVEGGAEGAEGES